MPAQLAAESAREFMKKTKNCCESILRTADRIWELNLSEETLAGTKYFRVGMGSGCACGALSGLIMISGILAQRYPHPRGDKLAAELYGKFVKQFGSSCCRVIRGKMTMVDRITNKECERLTAAAACIMVEAWDEVIKKSQGVHDDAGTINLGHHTGL